MRAGWSLTFRGDPAGESRSFVRIALLSDIHANLPALEAVLVHASDRGAARIWNLGDHVGYNAFPEETVQLLRARGAVSVVGDYDLRVLHVWERLNEWRDEKHPVKLEAIRWAADQLSAASRRYLSALPRKRQLTPGGHRFLLNHGSPARIDEGLSPQTPAARLAELAGMVEADYILGGDSHRAFVRRQNGTVFINPGSVGRADDADPRAAYALLRITEEGVQIGLFRVAYDVDRSVEAIRRRQLPEDFALMMIQGVSFNDLTRP